MIMPRVNLTGRKVEDIKAVLQALLSTDKLLNLSNKYLPFKKNKLHLNHPEMIRMPFNQDVYNSKQPLKICYFDFNSSQSVKRSILACYGHLTSFGHELTRIDTKLPLYDEIFEIGLKLYFNLNFCRNKGLISKVQEQESAYQHLLSLFNGQVQWAGVFGKILLQK